VPADDLYLVETCYSTNAEALVTTDQTLHQRLSATQNIKIKLRDAFLKEYLG
jgi:predicted nucleic acid-binding protein